ncbi:hypothetical protein [Pseudomarimonas arenosa]|uniref:Uncharacterized protein n=1 Tax=Pseudomarimonas arenosa TaxID=2774145 RepID=A0AAW3ZQV5_9GAMM|nr:hypothetical protein [Pseudomarimonas arenosa]MBD8526656.1 hypothetical protein [Pseudomarimonas arenosa]
MKTATVVWLLSLALSAPLAAAQRDLSAASEASALASVRLPSAALDVLAAAGHLAVISVEASGEGAVLVLRGASAATEFSLQLSAHAVAAVGVAAGSVLTVSAVSGGYLLSLAGEVLAFVPNALASSMMHRRRVP